MTDVWATEDGREFLIERGEPILYDCHICKRHDEEPDGFLGTLPDEGGRWVYICKGCGKGLAS